jgi:phosphoserine aminotransferase
MKKHNFGAGPGILPDVVIAEAAEAIKNFNHSGLSILEVSHRSKDIIAAIDEAEDLVRQLLNIGDDYGVIFLTGGASTQFFMSAMNLLNENETASYTDTGEWASRAIEEAKLFGKVHLASSSQSAGYDHIPTTIKVADDSKYLHITTNNTIYGAQYHFIPQVNCPIVADMSSDIFSRQINGNDYGMIYAGAQKNMGAAGVTLVVIKKSLLGKVNRTLPTMLDYRVHISKKSSYNTPPVYPIYVSLLTLRWILAQGGLLAMEKLNKTKADLFYTELERNELFVPKVKAGSQSWMNATFLTKDKTHEALFSAYCKANGIIGIEGHRSVGGFRASMYNALGLDSVQFLVELMQNFKP